MLIQVFEHDTLLCNGSEGLTPPHLAALQAWHGAGGNPYFTLVHNGLRFCEYVGVIQVGNLTIEILPKADRHAHAEKAIWHGFLVEMLRATGFLNVSASSDANLKLGSGTILDLYINLFLEEVIRLQHAGLVKKYRKETGNARSMKGVLLFAKQIQQNHIRADRFYVRHAVYDRDHIFHQVINKALELIKIISNGRFNSLLGNILFDFPDCTNIEVNENSFNRLLYDRKTETYRKAMQMARLILLNYHPDIRTGNNPVLALMFDMNQLWERYVFKKMQQHFRNQYTIKSQVRVKYWKPNQGFMKYIIPDMVVCDKRNNKVITVLDTKWKNRLPGKPDDADLKQMMAYNYYLDCRHSALVYPATENRAPFKGIYQLDDTGCAQVWLTIARKTGHLEIDWMSLITYFEQLEI